MHQDLLDTQMGMRLTDMQHMAALPLEDRSKHQLADAHLPDKGFYFVRSVQPKQLAQSSPRRWSQLGSFLRSSKQSSQRSLQSTVSGSPPGIIADAQPTAEVMEDGVEEMDGDDMLESSSV